MREPLMMTRSQLSDSSAPCLKLYSGGVNKSRVIKNSIRTEIPSGKAGVTKRNELSRQCYVKLRRSTMKSINSKIEYRRAHILQTQPASTNALNESGIHENSRNNLKESLKESGGKIRKCIVRVQRIPMCRSGDKEVQKQIETVTGTDNIGKETGNSLLRLDGQALTQGNHGNFSKPGLKRTLPRTNPINKKSRDTKIRSKAHVENATQNIRNITGKSKSKILQKVVHKSEEIDRILDSSDEKQLTTYINLERRKLKIEKTRKFFHRDYVSSRLWPKSRQFTLAKTTVTVSKHNSKKRNSISPNKNDVYEFSKSQMTDSDTQKEQDPAADIIKKLINEGKARVATTCKGKGRPIIKRRPNAKTVKKLITAKRKNILKRPPQLTDVAAGEGGNKNIPKNGPTVLQEVNGNTCGSPSYEPDGTFSRLARSVLLKQTTRNDMQRIRSQHLLAVAHKFVSTPKSDKSPPLPAADNINLSPVVLSPLHRNYQSCNASPWRVDEDAQIPRVFNFNCTSTYLPSFSSDFISSTPRKDKQKNLKTDSMAHLNSLQSASKVEVGERGQPNSANELSSFMSNDSNAENIPPKEKSGFVDRGEGGPNAKHSSSHRSPLKSINIIEVVNLPSWKAKKQIDVNGNDATSESNSKNKKQTFVEEVLPDESTNFSDGRRNVKNDLYGFEEFLENESCDMNTEIDDDQIINKSLRDKLNELRKWRPTVEEERHVQRTSKPLRGVRIFDDEIADDNRQRDIKEMFCSTMIQPPSSRANIKDLPMYDGRMMENLAQTNPERSELFKDVDPETTFNGQDPHRTYIRHLRKKRRLHEKDLVMFWDSDESDNENHENESNEEKGEEVQRRIKRHHVDPTTKSELNEFVTSFNEMCKEVEPYELVVEKSA